MNLRTFNHCRGPLRPARTLAFLALTAASLSCGYQPSMLPDWQPPLAEYMERVVTEATDSDILNRRVLPNSYIVTFREEAGQPPLGFASYRSEYQHHFGLLAERYLADPRIKDLRYITKVDMHNPGRNPAAEDLAAPPDLRLAWQQAPTLAQNGIITEVIFQNNDDARALLREWEADKRIWFAEPNYVNELQDVAPSEPSRNLTANAYANVQEAYKNIGESGWWHKSIRLEGAYAAIAADTTRPLSTPVIAVLDSGIDIENPILKNKIWTNPSPGASGCDDDVHGCDTTSPERGKFGRGTIYPHSTSGHGQQCGENSEGKPDESCAHGTHVAGIIAGDITTNRGVGGVCPVCQIMMIKIIKDVGGKGAALDSAILNGLKYLTVFKRNNGSVVRVANASFGKYTRSRSVAMVVSVLKQSPHEILLIGAAGNEDSMLRVYPAALNDAIAVSATGPNNGKAHYSNFGPWVDIAAPGGRSVPVQNSGDSCGPEVCILSAVPGATGASTKQGTSMAAPVVAGIAGMILSFDPSRSASELRKSLIQTSDQGALYPPGSINESYYFPKLDEDNVRRPLLGAGLVDATAALEGKVKPVAGSASLRRVNRGCGVGFLQVTARDMVGSTRHASTSLLLLMLAPLLILLFKVLSTTPLNKGLTIKERRNRGEIP